MVGCHLHKRKLSNLLVRNIRFKRGFPMKCYLYLQPVCALQVLHQYAHISFCVSTRVHVCSQTEHYKSSLFLPNPDQGQTSHNNIKKDKKKKKPRPKHSQPHDLKLTHFLGLLLSDPSSLSRGPHDWPCWFQMANQIRRECWRTNPGLLWSLMRSQWRGGARRSSRGANRDQAYCGWNGLKWFLKFSLLFCIKIYFTNTVLQSPRLQ